MTMSIKTIWIKHVHFLINRFRFGKERNETKKIKMIRSKKKQLLFKLAPETTFDVCLKLVLVKKRRKV